MALPEKPRHLRQWCVTCVYYNMPIICDIVRSQAFRMWSLTSGGNMTMSIYATHDDDNAAWGCGSYSMRGSGVSLAIQYCYNLANMPASQCLPITIGILVAPGTMKRPKAMWAPAGERYIWKKLKRGVAIWERESRYFKAHTSPICLINISIHYCCMSTQLYWEGSEKGLCCCGDGRGQWK